MPNYWCNYCKMHVNPVETPGYDYNLLGYLALGGAYNALVLANKFGNNKYIPHLKCPKCGKEELMFTSDGINNYTINDNKHYIEGFTKSMEYKDLTIEQLDDMLREITNIKPLIVNYAEKLTINRLYRKGFYKGIQLIIEMKKEEKSRSLIEKYRSRKY